MLVKHNNNSISDLTSAGQLAQGKMTLISSQTASGSASIEFTSGIDSTYPIYRFEFINVHPSAQGSGESFSVNFRDGGTDYDATKTTTVFTAYHREDDSVTSLAYRDDDIAQGTGFQLLCTDNSTDADHGSSGELWLFNPSSTTFVKHFMARTSPTHTGDYAFDYNVAGYCNTTTAIDGVQFKYLNGSASIETGTIKLYGIKGD